MKTFLAIFLFLLGFITLMVLSAKEKDMDTFWKMIISACCGVFATGGVIGLLLLYYGV